MNLRECISHTPPQSSNKAEHTLALKPGEDVTRSPKQGYQWPQKWTCVQQKLKKKNLLTCDVSLLQVLQKGTSSTFYSEENAYKKLTSGLGHDLQNWSRMCTGNIFFLSGLDKHVYH